MIRKYGAMSSAVHCCQLNPGRIIPEHLWMLEIRNLDVAIQSVQILRDVSFDVPTGTTVGLIGRNGAGKTTLMKSIMGLARVRSGSVAIDSTNLLALPTHARSRLGIGYMPEDRRLIPDLSVEENVLVPAWAASLPDARA